MPIESEKYPNLKTFVIKDFYIHLQIKLWIPTFFLEKIFSLALYN